MVRTCELAILQMCHSLVPQKYWADMITPEEHPDPSRISPDVIQLISKRRRELYEVRSELIGETVMAEREHENEEELSPFPSVADYAFYSRFVRELVENRGEIARRVMEKMSRESGDVAPMSVE